jgi:hypothetical protein
VYTETLWKLKKFQPGRERLKLTQKLRLAGLAITALAMSSTNLIATALPLGDGGILQITNLAGSAVGLTTVPTCFNWGGGSTCAGAAHQFSVSGSSADFSTASSSTNQIKDLAGFGAVSSFETVAGGADVGSATVTFDLTSIPTKSSTVGNCASNAPLNTCSPAGSPFTLSEGASGTQLELTFSALLNGYTGTSLSGNTAYLAIFATQFAGTFNGTGACSGVAANITNFLNCEAAGGTVITSWSAVESPTNATTGVPEPNGFGLLVPILAGMAWFRSRRCKS